MYKKDWKSLNIYFLKSQSFFGKEGPRIPANRRHDLKVQKALKNFNIDMNGITKNNKYIKNSFQEKRYLNKKSILLFFPIQDKRKK